MAQKYHVIEIDAGPVRKNMTKWHALRRDVYLRLSRTAADKTLIFGLGVEAETQHQAKAAKEACYRYIEAMTGSRASVTLQAVRLTPYHDFYAEFPDSRYILIAARTERWPLKTPYHKNVPI